MKKLTQIGKFKEGFNVQGFYICIEKFYRIERHSQHLVVKNMKNELKEKNNLDRERESRLQAIHMISLDRQRIDKLEVAGEGALLKLIEERKERLRKKGYFDPINKKNIPFLPSKIGFKIDIKFATIILPR